MEENKDFKVTVEDATKTKEIKSDASAETPTDGEEVSDADK